MAAPERKVEVGDIELYKLVEHNALLELVEHRKGHGASLWNRLIDCKAEPKYPNQGTPVMWAVWHRHWDIVALAAATGADLDVVGRGSWMEGRKASTYAELLDSKAGHPYFEHVKMFNKATSADGDGALMLADAVLRITKLRSRTLPRLDEALVDDELMHDIHDMVENHCTDALIGVCQVYGAATGGLLVGPRVNPYGGMGTLAHWCVWYGHYDLLNKLEQAGGVARAKKARGSGWLKDTTVDEYAEKLKASTAHPFYNFVEYVKAVLDKDPAAMEVVLSRNEPRY